MPYMEQCQPARSSQGCNVTYGYCLEWIFGRRCHWYLILWKWCWWGQDVCYKLKVKNSKYAIIFFTAPSDESESNFHWFCHICPAEFEQSHWLWWLMDIDRLRLTDINSSGKSTKVFVNNSYIREDCFINYWVVKDSLTGGQTDGGSSTVNLFSNIKEIFERKRNIQKEETEFIQIIVRFSRISPHKILWKCLVIILKARSTLNLM